MALFSSVPPVISGSFSDQMHAVKSFLSSLCKDLNFAFQNLDFGNFCVETAQQLSNTSLTDEQKKEIANTANDLRSIIITNATEIYQEIDRMTAEFDSIYVAKSDFGTYIDEEGNEVEWTASGLVQQFENIQTIVSNNETEFDSYVAKTNASIIIGKLYEEDGIPMYGVGIGQHIETQEGVDEEGNETQEVVSVSDLSATFTADRLRFWDNGDWVAEISRNVLTITNAVIKNSLSIGGFTWSYDNEGLLLSYDEEDT